VEGLAVELGVITLQQFPVVEYQVKEIVVEHQILLVEVALEVAVQELLVDWQLEERFLQDLVEQV
jgi:hypothetical protein